MTSPEAGNPRSSRREVLDAIWRRERHWIAAILLAHMPRQQDLEDLLQEVAVAFLSHVDELRDVTKLRPWLRAVAVNVARTAGRRASTRRQHLVPLAEHAEFADTRRVRESEQAEARRSVAQVLELAESLPPDYREPLILRCVRGFSQKKIAQLLGVPETTIETRLVRARKRLRETLAARDQSQWREGAGAAE